MIATTELADLAKDLGPGLGPLLIAGFLAVLVLALLITGLWGRR